MNYDDKPGSSKDDNQPRQDKSLHRSFGPRETSVDRPSRFIRRYGRHRSNQGPTFKAV